MLSSIIQSQYKSFELYYNLLYENIFVKKCWINKKLFIHIIKTDYIQNDSIRANIKKKPIDFYNTLDC